MKEIAFSNEPDGHEHETAAWFVKKTGENCSVVTTDNFRQEAKCDEKKHEDKPKKPICAFG